VSSGGDVAPEEDETGFLGRWSRRKQTQGEEAPAERSQMDDADASEGAAEVTHRNSAPITEEELAQLPPAEDLSYESNFKAYLREGVPEVLKRQALRQLWRSNPVLANLDGLAEYDEDFTGGGVLAGTLQSAYKAGKGYFDKESETAEVRSDSEKTGDTVPDSALAKSESEIPDPKERGSLCDRESGQRSEVYVSASSESESLREEIPEQDVTGPSIDVESRAETLPPTPPSPRGKLANSGAALRRRWGNPEG